MILSNLKVQRYKLGDACKITSGFAFFSSKYREFGKPIIRAGNLRENKIDDSSLVYFDEADYDKNLNKYIVRPLDVLIVSVGSNCGDISQNQTDKIFHLAQNVWKIDAKSEILDKRFLYHFFLSANESIRECISSSTTYPMLNRNKFNKIEIPVPPMDTQIQIANKLDIFREIEREITLRNKQYEYYRSFLIGN